ncbi:MAG: hypothetical protein M1817_001394 [Caeruleum heppii]|nr:MAG: hypothetical protein M1817_001394 [Caeruleum heppii]
MVNNDILNLIPHPNLITPAESKQRSPLRCGRTSRSPLPSLARPGPSTRTVSSSPPLSSLPESLSQPYGPDTSATPPTPGHLPSHPTTSPLHPRVAVILGVSRCWHIPLLLCRALSILPSTWWGLRCALTFLAELVLVRETSSAGTADPRRWGWGWDAVGYERGSVDSGAVWDAEKRFRITEVALAALWCCASAYLSYFFTDCLMSRWLVNYAPQATLVRLLTVNAVNAYITSWVLFLAGASEDPRLLLPAWISIASTLTVLYHVTQRKINIKKETSASISVFSIVSSISMCALLVQLHLARENDPVVPLFDWSWRVWTWLAEQIMTPKTSAFL